MQRSADLVQDRREFSRREGAQSLIHFRYSSSPSEYFMLVCTVYGLNTLFLPDQ
jgi:hypothetical protein